MPPRCLVQTKNRDAAAQPACCNYSFYLLLALCRCRAVDYMSFIGSQRIARDCSQRGTRDRKINLLPKQHYIGSRFLVNFDVAIGARKLFSSNPESPRRARLII